MTKCDFVTGKKYPMTQQKFEKLAKERIVNLLPIGSEDVFMVWFNFTLGNVAIGMAQMEIAVYLIYGNPKEDKNGK